MGDIIKTILANLPKDVIKTVCFEGANIVLYTSKKDFFLEGEERIKEIVNKIKKRIELRIEEEFLVDEEKARTFIEGLIPSDAEITQIVFDSQRSTVIIEAKKPGIAIGKAGENLKEIRRNIFWTPQVKRSPVIESKITTAIRRVLYVNGAYRKKFLNSIGKRIYKEWNPEKKEEWVRVSILGAGRQVGRSCLLLHTPESKILLDCGIDIAASERERFPYLDVPEFNLKEIDAVIISHAHLDHSGLVPYLYKMGYQGPCYMTEPTRDIAALLALDFIDVSYKKAAVPLYSASDIHEMVKHSVCLEYGSVTDITPDIRITFYDAGHALGSSMVHINIGNGLHNLLYTADMKFGRTRLLETAEIRFPRLETLILEATYGGKADIQPSRKEEEIILLNAIKRTIERKGKVLMPVLGVGRSQEVMLVVEEAMRNNLLPKIPIYIDGMVWDVTAIHTAYPEFMHAAIKNQIFRNENPFGSEVFKRIGSAQERKEVIEGGPCIIIATSGMLVGGASTEYFRELADSKRNTLIFTCYQGVNSLGRQVQEGLKEAKFDVEGKEEVVEISMEIVTIAGLSGHSDRNQLLAFVKNIQPEPKKIILNHGESSKCLDLSSSLFRMFHVETSAPRNLDTIRLR